MTDIVKRLRGPTQEFRGLHEEAADEIDRLKDLLAEAYADADDVLRPRVADIEQQLAESQAREKVLLDALGYIAEWNRAFRQTPKEIADNALAQPSDDTALKAALAAERERCALVCDGLHDQWKWGNNEPESGPNDCAKAIRALGD